MHNRQLRFILSMYPVHITSQKDLSTLVSADSSLLYPYIPNADREAIVARMSSDYQ